MHYLAEYGLFIAKIATLVVAFLILLAGTLSILLKGKTGAKETLRVKKINAHYENLEEALQKATRDKKHYKIWVKTRKEMRKSTSNTPKRRIFVLAFHGDIKASAVDALREEVTAVLSIASEKDEVVVCLESAGGMVHSYGLAASQLQRFKNKHIPLTIIIDKVAASGGYLMACVADKVIAAPFAIIGSIGVIAQMPNFHRFLEKNYIDFEQISAGEYKRTLSLFGENTEKGREKLQEELQDIHAYFKQFIIQHRPHVDIEKVATGEHWLAAKAIEYKLIDSLSTSDDYLFKAHHTADILKVSYRQKKSLGDKLSALFRQSRAQIQYLF